MNIIRRQPQSLLAEIIKELRPDVFEKAWFLEGQQSPAIAGTQWQPAVDIEENDKVFIITVDIPGVDPKNIAVHMENGVLSIHGERDVEKKEMTDRYKKVEREWGTFERRFILPKTVDAEHIIAKSKHGVLELKIPKSEEKKGGSKINIETIE